ncbi:MAG: hypothetical protein ACE5GD_05310 [Candidatus Geothermarchaeales archaeon]
MRVNLISIGLALLIVGGVLVLSSIVVKQKTTYDAVTLSGVVKAGESNWTLYHTRVFAKSKLHGSLGVVGGDIYLHIKGFNVDEKRYVNEKIHVSDSYSFSFSAEDLYNFYFNNTHSDEDKVIAFDLKEEAIEPPPWLLQLSVISLFFILPAGLILIVVGYIYERRRRR